MENENVLEIASDGRLKFITREGSIREARLSGDWQLLSRGGQSFFRLEGSILLILDASRPKNAFCVSVRGLEGTVVQLCELNEARIRPGVICFQRHCYVFGGMDGAGIELKRSAERLALSSEMEEFATTQWESLTSMISPRASFLPCVYNDKIYLCGGFTFYCEVYDPVKQTYTVLPFTLREFDTRSHLAVFVNQTIVIISQCWVTLWKLSTSNEIANYEIDKVPDPYSSGGVLMKVPNSYYSGGVLVNPNICTLYYVAKGQLVSLKLQTSFGI